MSFIPEQPKVSVEVPFFDDVTGGDGWQGHATSKSIETLKSEIILAIGRLDGVVTSFQRGSFQVDGNSREGFQIGYAIESPNGQLTHGRIDIAALPVRKGARREKTLKARKEKSLKMALYMFRTALEGQWFMQQLSPGYAALMPWMLGAGGKTITQLWSENIASHHLLTESAPQGE